MLYSFIRKTTVLTIGLTTLLVVTNGLQTPVSALPDKIFKTNNRAVDTINDATLPIVARNQRTISGTIYRTSIDCSQLDVTVKEILQTGPKTSASSNSFETTPTKETVLATGKAINGTQTATCMYSISFSESAIQAVPPYWQDRKIEVRVPVAGGIYGSNSVQPHGLLPAQTTLDVTCPPPLH